VASDRLPTIDWVLTGHRTGTCSRTARCIVPRLLRRSE